MSLDLLLSTIERMTFSRILLFSALAWLIPVLSDSRSIAWAFLAVGLGLLASFALAAFQAVRQDRKARIQEA